MCQTTSLVLDRLYDELDRNLQESDIVNGPSVRGILSGSEWEVLFRFLSSCTFCPQWSRRATSKHPFHSISSI